MTTKRFLGRIFFTTALLLITVFAIGQSERKMAKIFVEKATGISVYVTPPSFLYKYNLKTGILDTIPYYTRRQKDSILWVHSDYIQHIRDSVFIHRFMQGYINELKVYGFHVVPHIGDSNTYQVHVAQIELEEQYYFYSDTAYYNYNVYVHHQYLNALDVSSWFALRGPLVKSKSEKPKILFAENLLTDDINGHFEVDPYSGKIKYLYTLDSLTVKKIYDYAENLGRTYAGYTFDYLMNRFLKKYVPPSRRTKRYWRYDPYRKKFFFALNDRFIPLRNTP